MLIISNSECNIFQMETIAIVSMICGRLADKKKQRDSLKNIRGQKPDLVLVQNIHLDDRSTKRIILEW